MILDLMIMSDRLWLRRRLLGYLGLGTVATIAATVSSPSALTNTLVSSQEVIPDFQGIVQWLNSRPLTVKQLTGQVILVQFWTFSCINCKRTLPYVINWHNQYADRGLKVIGIHTPEFAYERDSKNVEDALKQWKIRYPVPMDNNFTTWKAYGNQYWPNLYLADRQGILRYQHAGEGAYDLTEQTIRNLLAKS